MSYSVEEVNRITRQYGIRTVDWDGDREGRLVAKKYFVYPPNTPVETVGYQVAELVAQSTFTCDDGEVLQGTSAHLGTGDTFHPDHQNFLFICNSVDPTTSPTTDSSETEGKSISLPVPSEPDPDDPDIDCPDEQNDQDDHESEGSYETSDFGEDQSTSSDGSGSDLPPGVPPYVGMCQTL